MQPNVQSKWLPQALRLTAGLGVIFADLRDLILEYLKHLGSGCVGDLDAFSRLLPRTK